MVRGVRETDLIEIVQHLGNVRVDPRSPIPVRYISPQHPRSAKVNTLSSRYGTDAFPFHTDTAHWDREHGFRMIEQDSLSRDFKRS